VALTIEVRPTACIWLLQSSSLAKEKLCRESNGLEGLVTPATRSSFVIANNWLIRRPNKTILQNFWPLFQTPYLKRISRRPRLAMQHQQKPPWTRGWRKW